MEIVGKESLKRLGRELPDVTFSVGDPEFKGGQRLKINFIAFQFHFG